MGLKSVSLADLAGGAAVERFNYEWDRVMQNIGDFNADAEATRTVTLVVKIKPNHERNFAVVDIGVTSKLAPIKSQATAVHLTQHGGSVIATEHNTKQTVFEFRQEGEL